MKEHEKRCKVTEGQGISFPPKPQLWVRFPQGTSESIENTKFSMLSLSGNLCDCLSVFRKHQDEPDQIREDIECRHRRPDNALSVDCHKEKDNENQHIRPAD